MIVRDCDLDSAFDRSDCMDGFVFFVAVPAVVSVRVTAVIDETCSGVDAANGRSGSTRQSIRLEDAAERVFARSFVVKRQELTLY